MIVPLWRPPNAYLKALVINSLINNPVGIASHAKDIAMEAGFSHAMPPGNISEITDDERKLIVAWYRSTNQGKGPLEIIQ